jgi:hypothetical protein
MAERESWAGLTRVESGGARVGGWDGTVCCGALPARGHDSDTAGPGKDRARLGCGPDRPGFGSNGRGLTDCNAFAGVGAPGLALLHQHIDDLPVLIDGPIQIQPPTGNFSYTSYPRIERSLVTCRHGMFRRSLVSGMSRM